MTQIVDAEFATKLKEMIPSTVLEVGSEIECYVEVKASKRDVGAILYWRLVVGSDC